MAPALCFRILEHLEELGLLQKGDCLLDPMAGTGMTGLVATVKGYPSILVELEPRFCEFIRQNKEALEKKLGHAVDITCIQGDSRHLSELLSERGLIQVCSPPYGDIMGRESHSDGVGGLNSEGKPIYGANPANIGNLKEGSLVQVVSPPFLDSLQTKDKKFIEEGVRQSGKPLGLGASVGPDYGTSKGQIGRMPEGKVMVTSHLNGNNNTDIIDVEAENEKTKTQSKNDVSRDSFKGIIFRETNEPIRNSCPVAPFPISGLQVNEGLQNSVTLKSNEGLEKTGGLQRGIPDPYISQTDRKGNLRSMRGAGQTGDTSQGLRPFQSNIKQPSSIMYPLSSEPSQDIESSRPKEQLSDRLESVNPTYWSAMSLVYAESLRCCDVLAVVVKDPTRKGKLHPLGELTWRCLEAQGWRIVDYHQAILFTETEQGHLFDGKVKKVKGRLSFFKRLSYQKGSPVANCEHVIIAVNPNGRRWGKCQVTSPPYGDMLNSSSQHGNSGIAARDKSIGDLGRYASQTPGQIGNMPEGIIQLGVVWGIVRAY